MQRGGMGSKVSRRSAHFMIMLVIFSDSQIRDEYGMRIYVRIEWISLYILSHIAIKSTRNKSNWIYAREFILRFSHRMDCLSSCCYAPFRGVLISANEALCAGYVYILLKKEHSSTTASLIWRYYYLHKQKMRWHGRTIIITIAHFYGVFKSFFLGHHAAAPPPAQ